MTTVGRGCLGSEWRIWSTCGLHRACGWRALSIHVAALLINVVAGCLGGLACGTPLGMETQQQLLCVATCGLRYDAGQLAGQHGWPCALIAISLNQPPRPLIWLEQRNVNEALDMKLDQQLCPAPDSTRSFRAAKRPETLDEMRRKFARHRMLFQTARSAII